MTALLAATIGAILGGAFQALLRFWEWHAGRVSTYQALTAEIRMLCAAARRECLAERYHTAAFDLGLSPNEGGYVTFPSGMSLTPVYDANVAQIGRLRPRQADLVTQFYFWATLIQTQAGPSGGLSTARTEFSRRRQLAYLAYLSRAMLNVGDRICPDRLSDMGVIE